MPLHLPSNVREHRKRWALSQDELSYLLRLATQGAVSSHETLARTPGARVLFRYEALFDVSVSELFPALRDAAEDEVAARAKHLIRQLERSASLSAQRKLELLTAFMRRAEGRKP